MIMRDQYACWYKGPRGMCRVLSKDGEDALGSVYKILDDVNASYAGVRKVCSLSKWTSLGMAVTGIMVLLVGEIPWLGWVFLGLAVCFWVVFNVAEDWYVRMVCDGYAKQLCQLIVPRPELFAALQDED